MLTIESIRQAQRRIHPHINRTPLLRLNNLDEYLGCKVYAKMESFQKVNAFKARGALNASMTLPEEALKKGIVTASSGNHGKAIAYAAKQLGTTAHVVVPEGAPPIKVEGIRSYGAEIIFSTLAERYNVAKRLSEEKNWTFVSPFDNYEVMAGQGTAGLEILEDLPDVDYLIVPVGGGGLISGVSTAIKESNPQVKVIGAEPALVARYSKSFEAGHPIALPAESKSIADGLQTLEPGVRNYPIVEKYVDEFVGIEEENIIKGTKLFLTEGKLLAEFSSCITLGAILQGAVTFNPNDKVVLFITGGNIGLDQFSKFENVVI